MIEAHNHPRHRHEFHGGIFGGGGGTSQLALLQQIATAQAISNANTPPPPANPAIAASSQIQPGAAAKNARVAAGLAGSFDNTLLTGAGGAVPMTGGGSKTVVGG